VYGLISYAQQEGHIMNIRQTLNEMMETLKEYQDYQERLNLITANQIDICNDQNIKNWLSVFNTIKLIKCEIKTFAKLNAIDIELI
jgi:GTPase involved in cell partitioning and DNA repair